ncbi:hypothetical protein PoHVEF18_003014 [Penicillium ochrochloron]
MKHAHNVEVRVGSAENVLFLDGKFDAVVAMVADITNPNARLVVVQGAPDDQLVNLLNDFCAPLSAENTRIDHQGYILHTTAKIFSENGFRKIEAFRVNAFWAIPEEDLEERCQKAADVLVGFWFKKDPNYEQMKTALIPHLKLHFKDRPHAIGDEVAILSARPFLTEGFLTASELGFSEVIEGVYGETL